MTDRHEENFENNVNTGSVVKKRKIELMGSIGYKSYDLCRSSDIIIDLKIQEISIW